MSPASVSSSRVTACVSTSKPETLQQFATTLFNALSELGEYNHRKALSYASDIREMLFDAVRLRLRADVPVGTCLSGGLDSSTVVAITAKLFGVNQGTSLAKFLYRLFSGSGDRRESLRALGCRSYPGQEPFHLSIIGTMPAPDRYDSLPSGRTVCRLIHLYAVGGYAGSIKHVKVLLDGQGGDEVFAGYVNYRVSFLANLLVKVGLAPSLKSYGAWSNTLTVSEQ